MATVAGLFVSPARGSGVSTALDRAGEAVFEITMVCDPCQRMDDLRPGLRAELDGKRGMLARVVESGDVAIGDELELL